MRRALYTGGALETHERVVVGLAGGLVDRLAVQQHVALRPVHLEVPGLDLGDPRPPLEAAARRDEPHAVSVDEPQPGGILAGDEHVLARGAGERVDASLDHRVELLAAARGNVELAVAGTATLRRRARELRLAVGRRERPVRVEPRPPPLDALPALRELLDARVERDRAGDLVADRLRRGERDARAQLRPHPRGHLAEDLPLRLGAADAAAAHLG